MGKMQRNKGYRGEAEAVKELQARGIPAYRRQKCKGGPEQSDVGVQTTPLAIEVKWDQSPTPDAWIKKLEEDSAQHELPMVMYRTNHKPWKIVMSLDQAAHLFTLAFRNVGEAWRLMSER